MATHAAPAPGRTFLMPNGEGIPGELGVLMGGAMTALAGGGEAVWFNPAGVVKHPTASLTVSGELLHTQSVALGEQSLSSTGTSGPSVALSMPFRGRPSQVRAAYGFALRTGPDHRMGTRFSETRTGSAQALPLALRAGVNVDNLFPDGFDIGEVSEGLGELRITSPAVAVAFAPGDGFRVGAGLRIDHVMLAERSLIHRAYSGASGLNTMTGYSNDAFVLEGRANRLVGTLGVQLEPTRGIALGLVVDFPSDTKSGSGRVELERHQSLTVDENGFVTRNNAAYFSGGESLPFRLESPMVIRLGIAMISDWFLAELDLVMTKAQAVYEVLPAVPGRSPSTGSVQAGPWTTSGLAAERWALGLAFTRSDTDSLLLGMVIENSPVPEGDLLFTPMDLNTVTFGFYRAGEEASGSVGIVLTQAEPHTRELKDTSTEESVSRKVGWESVELRVGGSISF